MADPLDILNAAVSADNAIEGVFNTLNNYEQSAMSRTLVDSAHCGSDFKLEQLQERVDKLNLVCLAMWELIREKTNLTEDDLTTRVAMIDARDGVADGKVTRRTQPCPKCQRPMSAEHRKCLYCGFAKPVETAFDAL